MRVNKEVMSEVADVQDFLFPDSPHLIYVQGVYQEVYVNGVVI